MTTATNSIPALSVRASRGGVISLQFGAAVGAGIERVKNMQTYIGDGVYAKFDGFAVKLWTDREENGRNWIVLEPRAFQALTNFWQIANAQSTDENQTG